MGMMGGVFRGLGIMCLVLASVLFGQVAAPVSVGGVAYAQSSQIIVEGNRRVEADTIRSYFHPPLNAQNIDAAYKALYATNLFQDVKISQAGGRLVVTVIENPVINKVAFEGNHKVKDEQFASEIQSKPRGTFSRAVVQSDVQRIVDIYRTAVVTTCGWIPRSSSCRTTASISCSRSTRPRDGGSSRIASLATIIPDWRLKDVIEARRDELDSSIKTTTTSIRTESRPIAICCADSIKNGYADVRICSALTEYDPVARGSTSPSRSTKPQRKVASVDFISRMSAAVNADALRYKCGANRHGVQLRRGRRDVEDISIEIAERGYPFLVVKPRGDRDFQNHTVTIQFVIDEVPRAYVERMNIRGNTRTATTSSGASSTSPRVTPITAPSSIGGRSIKALNYSQERREDHHRAGLRAGPPHHQCRGGGAVDRRVLILRRLFDSRRSARVK